MYIGEHLQRVCAPATVQKKTLVSADSATHRFREFARIPQSTIFDKITKSVQLCPFETGKFATNTDGTFN